MTVSCTPIDTPLRHLLDTLANQLEAPVNSLDPKAVAVALRYGWAYKFSGQMALTGAGHYHTGQERGAGLLE